MMEHRSNKNHCIRFWDWLLIVGLTLAPMNGLRIGKVGPAEVLCLLWCLPYIKNILHLKLSNVYLRFWLLFLAAIFAGTIYGSAFYPEETSAAGVVTYIYFAIISLGIYCGMKEKSAGNIFDIFKVLCGLIPIVYISLYVYSLYVSRSFLGAPLWYGNGRRFSGGADNPHQLAILIGAMLFGNLILLVRYSERLSRKILNVACICFCLFIAEETKSSTLVLSVVLTAAIAIYIFFLDGLKSKKDKLKFTILLITAALILIAIFNRQIYQYLYDWIASDDNGIGRLEIFRSITGSLRKSFLIGLGPGVHAQNGTIEYHNTYLEIFAMSGATGFWIFLLFSIRVFKQLKNTPALTLLIIPLYCYGLAGFAMRRLAYWVILSVVLALSERLYGEKGIKEKSW